MSTTKSPLTGTIMSSEAGGYWAPELKFAGFDGIIITGRSPTPVYLWVHDGEYELRDASAIWGKITGEAQDAIREELGDRRIRIAIIGPSGEKLVRFANVVNELKHFNGRGGIGAVMGSKNLKAIAVRGTLKPEWHNLQKILAMAKAGNAKVQAEGFFKIFKGLGTTMNVEWNSAIGGLPTKNWTKGTWEHQEDISAETYRDNMMDGSGTCWACGQACRRDIKNGINKPWTIEPRYGGPEYETVGMLGSNCLVHDLNAISKANEICSKYGIDTITAGGVAGFVMECFEKGILRREEVGIEARFGDGQALVGLVEMMAKREGFGNDMAEGMHRLALKLGGNAQTFDITVKGKEFPAHMPQTKGLMALAYALNPFGPDHESSAHDGEFAGDINEVNKGIGLYVTVGPRDFGFEKAKDFAFSQRSASAIDSFTVCNFCFSTWGIYTFQELLDCVNAATGWQYTLQEMMLLGERRITMMKIFNQREGFDSSADTLPGRIFEEGLTDDGPGKGAKVDRLAFFATREHYYKLNGWDPISGNPTDSKIRELGLEWTYAPAGA